MTCGVPLLDELARSVGGTITEVHGPLSDGSGFAMMSMPLPKDHWLTRPGENIPPMKIRIGTEDVSRLNMTRNEWAETIKSAARYAIRASTLNGTEMDFDPDAMLQNMVVGLIGYWTPIEP